jgi:hypothetical protein
MVAPNGFRALTMGQISAARKVCSLWRSTVLAGVLAAGGWGALAYNVWSSAADQDRLHQAVAELTTNHMQLAAERDEIMTFLAAARASLTVLGTRLESVATERDESNGRLAAAREQLTLRGSRGGEAQIEQTGSIRGGPPTAEPGSPRAMQKKGTGVKSTGPQAPPH